MFDNSNVTIVSAFIRNMNNRQDYKLDMKPHTKNSVYMRMNIQNLW